MEMIVVLVLAVLAVYGGVPAYRKYQAYQNRKNVRKFEQSLVDLQSAVKDALHVARSSKAPPKS